MAASSENPVGMSISSSPDKTEILLPKADTPRKAVQLPLRLLLVSDLTPRDRVADWADRRRTVGVDKTSFAQVMQRMAPSLEIEVANRVSDQPAKLQLSLAFPELKAFQPDGLAAQVPALAQLLQLRGLVDGVRTGGVDLPSFSARLSALGLDPSWAARLQSVLAAPARPASPPPPTRPAAGPTGAKEASLDRLFDLLGDGPAPAPPQQAPAPPSSDFTDVAGRLIHAVSGGGAQRVDRQAAQSVIDELDGVLGAQLNEILHHPEVNRLEAAWRGLKFLVDRINFRENIQLEVLPARKEDLAAALENQVLLAAPQEDQESPVTAIVLDYYFDRSLRDLEQLAALTGIGVSLPANLIAGVDQSFFGVKTPAELARLPVLWQEMERPDYVHYNALRGDPATKSLTLALPRFLLREAYGPEHPVKGLAFVEQNPSTHGARLWGNGALAVAAAVADSFARTGLPLYIGAPSPSSKIEDLPMWSLQGALIPLEVAIGEEKKSELAQAGFTVLGCRQNSNAAFLLDTPTVHRPDQYKDPAATAEARLHSTLPCQLFVTRAAHHLLAFQQELPPSLPPEGIEAELTRRLRSWLEVGGHQPSPEAVTVEVMETPNAPDLYTVAVRMKPPTSLFGEPLSLVMHFQIPR